jgi:hypothetical protein
VWWADWVGLSLAACFCVRSLSGSAFSLLLLLNVRLLGVSVALQAETKTEAEDRSSQILKPKPKTDISVWFGAVRFGFRFSVKICPL